MDNKPPTSTLWMGPESFARINQLWGQHPSCHGDPKQSSYFPLVLQANDINLTRPYK